MRGRQVKERDERREQVWKQKKKEAEASGDGDRWSEEGEKREMKREEEVGSSHEQR